MFDVTALHKQRFGTKKDEEDQKEFSPVEVEDYNDRPTPQPIPIEKAPTTSTGGFDVTQLHKQRFGDKKEEPLSDFGQAVNNFMDGEKVTAGNIAIKGLQKGGLYLLDKALSSKSIPKGIFDDAALGIGKLQGWCGVYAGRISTARNVGDSWGEKRQRIDKQKGIKAGDKILIPLGVKWVNGKPQGYGHVMVAITDENAAGDFAVAQSNADGRQNRNEGPGIATYGTYNVNELTKRYKSEWGAVNGKLKMNVWNKGIAQQITKSLSERAPSANASAQELAKFVAENGVTDLQSEDWWKNAKNKKEAWNIIQSNQGTDNSDDARVTTAGGKSTLSILGDLALKVGTRSAASFLDRLKDLPTNDQAPPDSDKSDYGPEALAKYVVENNISNLSKKKWWINSPVKDQAWKLINKMKGRSENYSDTFISADPGTGKKWEELSPGQQFDAYLAMDKENRIGDDGEKWKLFGNIVGNVFKTHGQQSMEKAEESAQKLEAEGGTSNQIQATLLRGLSGMVATPMALGGEGVQQISGGETLNNTEIGKGVKNIIFGAGGLSGYGAVFNAATAQPKVQEAMKPIMDSWQGVKDTIKNSPVFSSLGEDGGEFLDLGLDLSLFYALHKGWQKTKGGVKSGASYVNEKITTKDVTYSPAEVKSALAEITTGRNADISTPLKTELQRIMNLVEEGVDNKVMLKESYTKGVTIKEARNFTKWFNEFFKNIGKNKGGPFETNLSPEFQKLLTDGKKAANGDISEVQFTKQAREVLVKGESATLRDSLPAIKDGVTPEMYNGTPGATSVSPALDKIAESRARLNDLQEQGKQSVFQVEANKSQALSLDTYTYSDGKVGVGFNLSTEVADIRAPISGKFETPREAVKAVVPIIEEAIAKGSDIASEAVRAEIDKLKESNYSTIPKKGEIAPWEDNHTPGAPENIQSVKEMSKQAIESEIKSMLDDYIHTAMKDGKGQGVIATQRGRKTNNDNWYVKAFKENGGRRPTKQQIREIATDHLLNGVTDRSIGEMPPNKRFKQLVERLPAAKPDRALKTVGEPAKIPNEAPAQIAEFKSTISTPESRLAGEQAPISSDGKTVESKQRVPDDEKVPEYKKVKVTEQVAKAEKFVEENFDLAKKVMRNLDSVPEDLDRGSVLSALRDKARDIGDAKLEAEAQVALNKFKTRTAQDLALLKGDLNTTDYFVRQLLEARTKAKSTFSIEERSVQESLEAEVSKLRKQLKDGMLADENGNIPKTPKQRRMRSIKEAQSILDMLTCK